MDSPEVPRWFAGPAFLWEKEENWNTSQEKFEVSDDDPEVKKVINTNAVSVEESHLTRIGSRISNWHRAVRVVAMMRRFIAMCRRKIQTNKGIVITRKESEGHLSVNDLKEAENCLIRMIQQRYFEKELQLLRGFQEDQGRAGDKKRKAKLRKSSSLRKLDPFLNEAGFILVGGRLRRSILDDAVKHPVIIPRKGKLTVLFVRWIHEVEHSGRHTTQN